MCQLPPAITIVMARIASAPPTQPAAKPRPGARRSRADKTSAATRRRQRAQLAEIWGSFCWLCLARGCTPGDAWIDPEAKHPHPLSFTRDHVIPVSVGGADDLMNLRPAHKICNERRGNRYTSLNINKGK